MQIGDKPDTHLLCLIKDGERYIFTWKDTPEDYQEILRCLGRYAANEELNFSWYDAAVLSQQIRAKRASKERETPPSAGG